VALGVGVTSIKAAEAATGIESASTADAAIKSIFGSLVRLNCPLSIDLESEFCHWL